MFRRILVGFDGSPDACKALRAASALAAAVSGETTVLIAVPASHGETDEDRRTAFEAEAAPIRAIAEHELALSVPGGTSSVRVVAGDGPARDLAAYVVEHGYDLLVVGRHGRERATHGGLGRVARELADKAACPLLLIGDDNPAQSARSTGAR
jgi:nucleotide-binding universal stress UspA family protein